MNKRTFRVALRIGNSLFDSLYCSFPFGKLELNGDTLSISSPIHGRFSIDRDEVLSFEVRRSVFNRFVRIHHLKPELAKIIDIYSFRTNTFVSLLNEWKDHGM